MLSLHIDAMLGSNHGYFDPNVWYNEDELRKQDWSRSARITQEVAFGFVQEDYVRGLDIGAEAIRIHNANVQRGWKRLEVNRMMVFAGITKSNFQSVMRRALVWKPKFH